MTSTTNPSVDLDSIKTKVEIQEIKNEEIKVCKLCSSIRSFCQQVGNKVSGN